MILREIVCSRKDCGNRHKESGFNLGFPNWGHIAGFYEKETGEETAHLCPDCMKIIALFLNGTERNPENGMD